MRCGGRFWQLIQKLQPEAKIRLKLLGRELELGKVISEEMSILKGDLHLNIILKLRKKNFLLIIDNRWRALVQKLYICELSLATGYFFMNKYVQHTIKII
jgi:hypothetical protein